jgi:hypothetical protein
MMKGRGRGYQLTKKGIICTGDMWRPAKKANYPVGHAFWPIWSANRHGKTAIDQAPSNP